MIEEYIDIVGKCAEHCEAMLQCEQEKRQALLQHDSKRLEAVLSTQQAAIMKMESLEKKRVAAQAEAGYDGFTADELLQQINDEETKRTLSELFDRLGGAAAELRETNKTATEIANVNLKLIDRILQTPNRSDSRVAYKPNVRQGMDWNKGIPFEEKI